MHIHIEFFYFLFFSFYSPMRSIYHEYLYILTQFLFLFFIFYMKKKKNKIIKELHYVEKIIYFIFLANKPTYAHLYMQCDRSLIYFFYQSICTRTHTKKDFLFFILYQKFIFFCFLTHSSYFFFYFNFLLSHTPLPFLFFNIFIHF